MDINDILIFDTVFFLTAMEPKVIMMSALGRALYPGMLYDCRSDAFIPGKLLIYGVIKCLTVSIIHA